MLAKSVAHRASCPISARNSSFSRGVGPQLAPRPLGPAKARVARSLTAGRVQASFFGVGAPEAVVVAVVALIVFGPKGLADAAKSLGQALRSFQPTIREVAQISTELKSTLEQEIGLDEIKKEIKGVNTSLSDIPRAFDEKTAAAQDPNIEEMRRKSAEMAWTNGASAASASSSTDGAPAPAPRDTPTTPVNNVPATLEAPAPTKNMSEMSVEELEAELARRKAMQK